MSARTIVFMIAAVFALRTTPAFAQTFDEVTDNSLLVTGTSRQAAEDARAEGHPALDLLGCEVDWTSRVVPGLSVVRVPSLETEGIGAEAAALIIAALPEVERVSRDSIVRVSATPNDTLWSSQQPNFDAICARGMWEARTTATVAFAIIDSGVQLDHPDLEDNLLINTGETPNNSLDDDSNGVIWRGSWKRVDRNELRSVVVIHQYSQNRAAIERGR